MLWKICLIFFFLNFEGLSNDDVGEGGGKGHRISGDTAGSWFPNRRFP